jgi:hypothetical protein
MARATTRGRPTATATRTAKGPQRATVRRTGIKAKAVKQPAGKQGASTPQARKPGPVVKRTAAAAAPKVSKDALRAQVAKLERANANLRSRNKELKQAVEAAAGRIAQLEGEKRTTKDAAPVRAGRTPGRRAAGTEEHSDRDRGDAVSPGMAVHDPEPLGEADEKVVEHLNEEFSPE